MKKYLVGYTIDSSRVVYFKNMNIWTDECYWVDEEKNATKYKSSFKASLVISDLILPGNPNLRNVLHVVEENDTTKQHIEAFDRAMKGL